MTGRQETVRRTAPTAGGTRRRAETRRRLLDAAYEVFAEYSIRGAPIEVICERAGFTRGAFYSNFSSKEELFLELFDEHTSQRIAELRQTVGSMLAAADLRDVEQLRDVISRVSAVYLEPQLQDRNWYLMTVEFKALALRDEALLEKVRDSDARLQRELTDALAVLFEKVPVQLALPVADAARVLGTLYETAVERVIYEGAATPMESPFITEVLPRLLTAALFVPEGGNPSAG